MDCLSNKKTRWRRRGGLRASTERTESTITQTTNEFVVKQSFQPWKKLFIYEYYKLFEFVVVGFAILASLSLPLHPSDFESTSVALKRFYVSLFISLNWFTTTTTTNSVFLKSFQKQKQQKSFIDTNLISSRFKTKPTHISWFGCSQKCIFLNCTKLETYSVMFNTCL